MLNFRRGNRAQVPNGGNLRVSTIRYLEGLQVFS